MGRINDELYRMPEASECYAKALEFARDKKDRYLVLMNLSGLAITRGDWKEAERTADLALSLEPTGRKALGNLGMACLAQRKWKRGWDGYGASLGLDSRPVTRYANEATWTGEKGKSIVIHGEQGLGDEICFASMFPDAIRDSKRVVIECDPKLRGLFARSFPEATVYGTRWVKKPVWEKEDTTPDASISSGALGALYRTRDDDFPGTPYLKADPEKVLMWKSLWASKGKKAIGLAWTGGVQWTAKKFRTWKVSELEPFLSLEAHFVSLQYKDAGQEVKGTAITQYRTATLTDDYDDTAALVASLDLVITMQTAVAHLAGALGVPCIVFVPDTGQWRYGTSDRETIPWYNSVHVVHQRGNWKEAKERGLMKAKEILG